MAEPEVVKEEVKEPEAPKVSEMEQRALSMGWRPKEEWAGGEDDFIDAKEFVRRKPLFDKIDSTTKRLKNVEEALNNLASHHQKVKEVEYQRAVKELRLEKRAALKEGDTQVVLELEDKMDQLSEQRMQEAIEARAQVQQQQTQASPEFLTWVETNEWYLNDSEMNGFADGVAAAYIRNSEKAGKVITEQQVFSHVVDKVRKAYPEKFENPNRGRPSAVTSSDRSGKPTKGTYKPTDEERMIARSFVKQGVFEKEEDYYKERQQLQGDANG
jgi:hypothetical protein